jgi:hypothetical protein
VRSRTSAARHDADAGEASGDVLALVTLDVARIHPYEHNPRRAPNTEYDRIKASIRADGLSQPLVVTQRPGETDYIVHAGGNTRLRILKELFEETGDRRFATSRLSRVRSDRGPARPTSCSPISRRTTSAVT